MVASAVALTLAAAISSSVRLSEESKIHVDRTRAMALAEGVLELVQHQLRETVAKRHEIGPMGVVSLHGVERPYTISPIGEPVHRVGADGVEQTIRYYRVTASTVVESASATVHCVFGVARAPLFQHLVYWKGGLELAPERDTKLSGRIHVDGDLWLGSAAALTLDSREIRVSGGVHRAEARDGQLPGPISIRSRGKADPVVMAPGEDSRHPRWRELALTRWRGTLLDRAHGVAPVLGPEIEDLLAFDRDGAKGPFHAQARLVIENTSARDLRGRPLALPPGTVTETTLFNAHAGTLITVTDIDLSLLALAAEAFPAGGVLYAYRTDSVPARPNAVRLINGARLPAALTVVSESPVYILGDYNSVEPKPAAVLADALHVLSGAWGDGNGPAPRMRRAIDTECNLAILAGHTATSPDSGLCRLEDLIRLHEDWTGIVLTVRGSFTSSFASRIERRDPGAARPYAPPVRRWLPERAFAARGALPPATPDLVSIERILWEDGSGPPVEF